MYSINDYLTIVLPVCYGELDLTGAEILTLTPHEINMRIDGYQRRMKQKRIFTASFITVPLVNTSYRAPKRAVSVKKLLPDDFALKAVSEKKKESIMSFAETAERSRHGQS